MPVQAGGTAEKHQIFKLSDSSLYQVITWLIKLSVQKFNDMKKFILYEFQWNVYISPENGRTINQIINCSGLQKNCGVYILATFPLPLWDNRLFQDK
jgi:hypothetical protein